MEPEAQRAALAAVMEEQGRSLSELSRVIRRNPAYLQQYLKRGTPRTLAEEDRGRLARYLGVPESRLGGRAPGGMIEVARLDVGASAGPGRLVGEEPLRRPGAFSPDLLRALGVSPEMASIIRVEGDSMAPTLNDGDDILVDGGDAAARLRDGIYVLRMDDVLMVKRVSRAPGPGRISVISDNPQYRSWDDLPMTAVRLVGRVVWTGRRVR